MFVYYIVVSQAVLCKPVCMSTWQSANQNVVDACSVVQGKDLFLCPLCMCTGATGGTGPQDSTHRPVTSTM